MIPIYQTKFGANEGNCFAACVASIFEIAIIEVPEFGDGRDWYNQINFWLEKRYGFLYIEAIAEWYFKHRIGYHIINGISPRNIPHAVVGLNGKMIHDPFAIDGPGLEKEETIGVFIKKM